MSFDKELIFLIGAPRSGTTWLHSMLAAHPVIASSKELSIVNAYISPLVSAWQRQKSYEFGRKGTGLANVWSEAEFQAFCKSFLDDVYSRATANQTPALFYVDKCPGCANHVDVIDMFFPTAKYVHIIRDGRDVINSMLEASKGWGRTWAPGNIMRAAQTWKRHVQGARGAAKFKGRYVETTYETLQNKGADELERILNLLDLALPADQVRTIYEQQQFENMKSAAKQAGVPEGFYRRGEIGDWEKNLTIEEKYEIEKYAGRMLRQLGYTHDNLWWSQGAVSRWITPVQVTTRDALHRLDKIQHRFNKRRDRSHTSENIGELRGE